MMSLWKVFWKIKAIPRPKICVWKIINDFIIPIQVNVQKCGIVINPTCLFCRKYKEIASHALWLHKFACKVKGDYFPNLLGCLSFYMEDWYLPLSVDCEYVESRGSLKGSDSPIVLWSLWSYRNQLNVLGGGEAKFDPLCISR